MISEQALARFTYIAKMMNYAGGTGDLFTVVQRADPTHVYALELQKAGFIIWNDTRWGLACWLYTEQGASLRRLLLI